MSINATVDWITSSDRLPKSAAEWVVPAATAAALLAGITVVIKGTKKADKGPPMVSSWIPWLGNTWQLDSDGYAFLRAAQSKYPTGVFGITYAGQKLYFVTSPQLINQIHKQHKIFSFSMVQMGWTKNILSLSDKALFGSMVFPEKLAPHFDKNISPKNMMAILQPFDDRLQHIVAEMSLPNESVSLTDFIVKLTYKATAYAMFGPTFDAEATWEDFNVYDVWVWKIANGYPPSLLRGFVAGRERVIKAYERYLEAPHEPCELIAGQEQIARDAGFDSRDRGVMMLCNFWPVMANLPWGSLWTLSMQLQEPNGAKPLIDELDAAGAQYLKSTGAAGGRYYDHPLAFLQSSPSLPLLNSTYSETLRYATDSYSIRGVTPEEGTILGGYELKKGDTVVCSTRSVHMDEKEFEHAEKWMPERFIGDPDSNKGTEGDYKWMPFGGGAKICPGRHFAHYHVKILITTLLKNFRFEIDHSKSQLPIKLGPTNRGFGFRRPDGDLFVKITRIL
ncbi:Cytochrome P450 7B1 [Tulasnella sp. 330]|nr:Cytochrome P450 7B1 [Tulasnella sp. 330]KAG8878295.1 Cytochrome P450 7B1 [Tulasnella sp. 331]KAG8883744.1 Cytochrome P450 7B1 [Tulasnella sp. 332]